MAQIDVMGTIVLVDAEDVERILTSGIAWRIQSRKDRTAKYVRGRIAGPGRRSIYLHRFIMNAPAGLSVDHINCDGLDNRKENLRLCEHRENCRNQRLARDSGTGFKGVTRKGKRFVAQIVFNYQHKRLGSFATPEEAHAAYCAEAARLSGEFARFK